MVFDILYVDKTDIPIQVVRRSVPGSQKWSTMFEIQYGCFRMGIFGSKAVVLVHILVESPPREDIPGFSKKKGFFYS